MEQKKLVYGGALAGLSLVVSLLIHFPLIPQAPFLLYDLGISPFWWPVLNLVQDWAYC